MNLDDAVNIHRDWKLKLREALRQEHPLDEATIVSDHRCELGQWLQNEAKQRYGKLASYAVCVDKHAEFHRCAGKVAQAINAKRFKEAEEMLAASTEYMIASVEIAQAITELKNEALL